MTSHPPGGFPHAVPIVSRCRCVTYVAGIIRWRRASIDCLAVRDRGMVLLAAHAKAAAGGPGCFPGRTQRAE